LEDANSSTGVSALVGSVGRRGAASISGAAASVTCGGRLIGDRGHFCVGVIRSVGSVALAERAGFWHYSGPKRFAEREARLAVTGISALVV
jgi:hypothetical protein